MRKPCDQAAAACAGTGDFNAFLECMADFIGDEPYYVNSGDLGGGNINWIE
ncbi:MAG: hypothetical protein OXU20_05915 [Myxococcales bacterium]|nr:hypothetical protein [Myxococcales bacterium]